MKHQPTHAVSPSDTPNHTFKIVATLTGCQPGKSADGTEKYALSSMASTIDLTGERMAEGSL